MVVNHRWAYRVHVNRWWMTNNPASKTVFHTRYGIPMRTYRRYQKVTQLGCRSKYCQVSTKPVTKTNPIRVKCNIVWVELKIRWLTDPVAVAFVSVVSVWVSTTPMIRSSRSKSPSYKYGRACFSRSAIPTYQRIHSVVHPLILAVKFCQWGFVENRPQSRPELVVRTWLNYNQHNLAVVAAYRRGPHWDP